MKPSYKRHNQCKTRLYRIWSGIKSRCNNEKCNRFHHYGKQGIRICDEWKNDFIQFYEWSLKNGYKDNLSIDRINNDENYEPSNCRWVTNNVQARNKRITKSNKSGFIGVSLEKKSKKWRSELRVNSKLIFLGQYKCRMNAAYIRDKYILDNNLEHTLNFV